MKKSALILTVFFFIGSLTASAQMNQGQNQQNNQQQNMMMHNQGMMQGSMMQPEMMQSGMMGGGMMGGMMMQNMMGSGMCSGWMNQGMSMTKYMFMVNQMPYMQQELSLTNDQLNKMIDLQTEFKKQQVDHQAALTKGQLKLTEMLENNAPAAQIKKQMQQLANTRIDMKMAAYETAGEMQTMLNSNQKEELKNLMMQWSNMMQEQNGMMNRNGMMYPGSMMNQNYMMNRNNMMNNQNNEK